MWTSAYTQHETAILGFLRRRLPREDAEDLCQETFARAVAAGDALRDESRARAYLFRIAHNLMVSHLRRRGLVRIASDLGEGIDLEHLAESADPAGPEEQRHWNALIGRLQELLARLPADQRRVFQEGVLKRRAYAELAAETGWSIAKIKVDVYRARRELIAGLRDWRPAGAPRVRGTQEVE